MDREKFYGILKEENLDRYFTGDSQTVAETPFAFGCVKTGSVWLVYQTDERGNVKKISEEKTESEGLEKLLARLRQEKLVDAVFKAIQKKKK